MPNHGWWNLYELGSLFFWPLAPLARCWCYVIHCLQHVENMFGANRSASSLRAAGDQSSIQVPRRLQEQLEGVGHDSCQVLALLFYHILSGVVDCRIGNDNSMKPPMVQLGCDGWLLMWLLWSFGAFFTPLQLNPKMCYCAIKLDQVTGHHHDKTCKAARLGHIFGWHMPREQFGVVLQGLISNDRLIE